MKEPLHRAEILWAATMLALAATASADDKIPDPYAKGFKQLDERLRAEWSPDMAQTMLKMTPEPERPADAQLSIHVTRSDTGEPIDTFYVEMSRKTPASFADLSVPPDHLSHLAGYLSAPFGASDWVGKLHEGVEGPLTIKGVTRESWSITVRGPGYVRASRDITPDGPEAVLKFALQPAKARLRARLIDAATSKPVADAKVRFEYEVDGDGSRTSTDREHPLLSGGDGRFLFEAVPGAGYDTRITITREGYFTVVRELKAGDVWNEDLGDIPLTPYALISGKVVDAAGHPLKGQAVYVMPDDLDPTDQQEVVSRIHGTRKATGKSGKVWRLETDAEGRFCTFNTAAPWSPATPPMHAGTYRVVFGDPETDREVFKVEAGEKKDVTLKKASR